MTKTVLAVDPGRDKCGVAIACGGSDHIEVIHRAVIETRRLSEAVAELMATHHPDAIIVGNGTTSSQAASVLSALHASVETVDEQSTTLLARKRYFHHNPPRGLRRLIPLSLQTPPVPYDDYVAEILAERWLEKQA